MEHGDAGLLVGTPGDDGPNRTTTRPGTRGFPVAVSMLVVIVTLAAAVACRRPPPDDGDASAAVGLVERVTGCWELASAVEGADADTVREWIEEGALPEVVHLDTVRAEMEEADDEYRVAWSYVYSRRQRRPLAAWRPVPGDSIRVETLGALAGTVLRLSVESGRLLGTGSVFTDVRQLGEDADVRTAPVEARRRDCPE